MFLILLVGGYGKWRSDGGGVDVVLHRVLCHQEFDGQLGTATATASASVCSGMPEHEIWI